MNGALVRMAYGGMTTDERTGQQVPQYMMMQIANIVTQSRTYAFGPRGAPCNKYLVLEDGFRARRTLPMTVRCGIRTWGWLVFVDFDLPEMEVGPG